ncbi:hypothetical protein [Nocardia sp. CA-119907]|uniref:hypothetical protein n=1 Tax=Nocardia sp. CA-119907 TaxID=3239973 RepID=UPI003D9523D3
MFEAMFIRPMLAGMAVVVALVILPAALLLTVGREPAAPIPTPASRPDGCVMFCDTTTFDGGER